MSPSQFSAPPRKACFVATFLVGWGRKILSARVLWYQLVMGKTDLLGEPSASSSLTYETRSFKQVRIRMPMPTRSHVRPARCPAPCLRTRPCLRMHRRLLISRKTRSAVSTAGSGLAILCGHAAFWKERSCSRYFYGYASIERIHI